MVTQLEAVLTSSCGLLFTSSQPKHTARVQPSRADPGRPVAPAPWAVDPERATLSSLTLMELPVCADGAATALSEAEWEGGTQSSSGWGQTERGRAAFGTVCTA